MINLSDTTFDNSSKCSGALPRYVARVAELVDARDLKSLDC